jgi:hypothetical protein
VKMTIWPTSRAHAAGSSAGGMGGPPGMIPPPGGWPGRLPAKAACGSPGGAGRAGRPGSRWAGSRRRRYMGRTRRCQDRRSSSAALPFAGVRPAGSPRPRARPPAAGRSP